MEPDVVTFKAGTEVNENIKQKGNHHQLVFVIIINIMPGCTTQFTIIFQEESVLHSLISSLAPPGPRLGG